MPFFFSETNGEAACGASVAASVANFDMNDHQYDADFDDWAKLRSEKMFDEFFFRTSEVRKVKEKMRKGYITMESQQKN